MTTIKLSGLHGSLIGPLRTTDARHEADDALSDMLTDMESGGLLDPDDLAKIKTILQKYVGGGVTNELGATVPTGDAARAKYQGQVEHTRTVAAGYRDFWDKKNAELAASITR
jgi:hypothetical protein